MNKQTASRIGSAFCSLTAAVFITAPNLASAQEDGPFMLSTRLLDVQSGTEAHVESALADISAEFGNAGRPFNMVYQRIRGDLPAYVIYTPDANYNEMPPIDLDDGLIARVTDHLDGNTLLTTAINPALATNVEGMDTPDYMFVRVFSVPPANNEAFQEFMAETVAPALDEAGVSSRSGRNILGGSIGNYVLYIYNDSFPADTAQRLMQSMGERDYDRMIAQGESLVSGVQDLVYRFREDLSYMSD